VKIRVSKKEGDTTGKRGRVKVEKAPIKLKGKEGNLENQRGHPLKKLKEGKKRGSLTPLSREID